MTSAISFLPHFVSLFADAATTSSVFLNSWIWTYVVSMLLIVSGAIVYYAGRKETSGSNNNDNSSNNSPSSSAKS